MRRNGLNGGLLFTTSLLTVALGCARPSRAACTQDPLVPSGHVCSGVSVVPGTIGFSGTDVSVRLLSPSVFFNSDGASDQISISGDGALVFDAEGSVLVLSDGAVGLNLLNTGAGTAGSITVTTAAEAQPGPGPDPDLWRIEGAAAGIAARNLADGDITLKLNGLVVGGDAGVVARQDGAGAIDLALSGRVIASQGDGLRLSGAAPGIGIAARLNLATVTGASHGILVSNSGKGDVIVSTQESQVSGLAGDGIRVSDLDAGSIEITTEESDFDGIAAQGAGHGILAENGGGGAVRITIGKGDILGGTGDGLSVLNSAGSTDIILRLSGPAAARGGDSGIDTRNLGTGGTTIDAGEATDLIDGMTGDGLRAANGETATTGVIITTGFGDGVDAVRGGGSGIVATNAGAREIWIQTGIGAISGQAGDGISATNGTLGSDLTILAGIGTISGSDAGIDADNNGTGTLSITTLGEVTGAGAAGIAATNGAVAADIATGDDAVQGGDLILATHALVHGLGGAGITAINSGLGQLAITANAEVRADQGTGILALNGTIHDGSIRGSALAVETFGLVSGSEGGIAATNAGTGGLTVTAWDGVTGGGGDAIVARSGAADESLSFGGDLTIATFGRVLGQGGAGVRTFQSGPSGAATVIGVGDASSLRGLAAAIIAASEDGQAIGIRSAGDLQNLAGTRTALVVQTSGGRTDLTNDGSMTGRIAFGAFDDVLTNSGRWSLGGTSDFGAGADTLANTGTLIAANAAGLAERTVLAGLEDLTSSGLIDLSDDITGDVPLGFDSLEITGNFDGDGGALLLDAFLGGPGTLADRLVIGGRVSGRTGIVINNTNDGPPSVGSSLLLVDTAGSAGTEFVLADGPIGFGGQAWDLFWDGEDFYLQAALGFLQLEPAALPAILGGLWDISATGWQRNTRRLQGTAAADPGLALSSKGPGGRAGSVARGWAALILDERSGDGQVGATSGTALPRSDARFDQTTRAFIGGVDLTLPPDANGGAITVGALMGVVDSTVRFDHSGDRVAFDGPTTGLHLAYAVDGFRADLMIKRDRLDLEYFRAGPDAATARSDARSTGASLDFGVRLHETGSLSVEAVGTLSHVATVIEDFALGGSDYRFGTAHTTRGAFGVTLHGAYVLGATNVTPSATLRYWADLGSGQSSVIDAVVFGHEPAGNTVEASAMLAFDDPASGWTGFVSGSGFAGGAHSGVQAQIGLAVAW